MHALPPGFEFRPYVDGPGLYLGEKAIAFACAANHDPNPPWRLCLNVGTLSASTVFTATEAGALRYMAAWARKWEPEIRKAHEAVSHPFGHLAVRGPVPDTHHIRAKVRRSSAL